MSSAESWDKTCPICFKLLRSKKKVCLHCGFNLDTDQDSIKEKREEYIKFRRGKPNPIELKEKIFTAVALLVLLAIMMFVWYRQQ